MLISEVISKLQAFQIKKGDVEISVFDMDEYGYAFTSDKLHIDEDFCKTQYLLRGGLIN